MLGPTVDEFVAMANDSQTESDSSQESASAAPTAQKARPSGGTAAVSGTNPCAVTLDLDRVLAGIDIAGAFRAAAAAQSGTALVNITTAATAATAAAPVPTAVVPLAANPIPSSNPLPQVLRQYIEISERGITREYEVMTRVECIPVRDWLAGGMAYDELYKGMKVDPKVFNFHVRIITMLDGPYKGDAYVLAQDLYRIAMGVAVVQSTISEAPRCKTEFIESIVGPNIVQMLKFSSYSSAKAHPALPFVADKPDANWETYPHMKYMAEFNANFRHYCIDIAGDTLSGNTRALKRINDAIHNPTYEQRLMQGNGENLPLSERIEEVRENADGEVEAVLRQTTSVDDEGRSATVNEVHQYVTREEMERFMDELIRKHMPSIVQQAVDKVREETKEQLDMVIDTQELCAKTIQTFAAKFQAIVGVIQDVQRNQQLMQALHNKFAEALEELPALINTKLGQIIDTKMAPIQSRMTAMHDNFDTINSNFASMNSQVTGLNSMVTTFQNTVAKLDDNIQLITTMRGAQSAMQQPDAQQPNVQQPPVVQQPNVQQPPVVQEPDMQQPQLPDVQQPQLPDVQQPQQPRTRHSLHTPTKAALGLDWMEGLASAPLQELHVSAGLKRKVYKEKIKPMPGFSVLVADIMHEGPKHHPTVFKEDMRFEEAQEILAIACGGPRVGRKKIKLLKATYDDGTPVYTEGIEGYMLVPNADIDDALDMSASNENEGAGAEDAGAEELDVDHSTYNALPIGPGSEQEGGSFSQNAAELLLNFAQSENEMVPA